MPPTPRRLLLSIHDVAPAFEGAVDRLHAHLAQAGGSQLAMLVVPRHWASAPVTAGSPFATRLRGWSDAGVEMFVHGWTHRDETEHAGRWTRWKATRLTAGEGEFLGLGEAEARIRMSEGRALMEDVTGRPVAGFIAPAWLYGEGALSAAAAEGFAMLEDHRRVWRPRDRATLATGPVVTWASRSPARATASLAFAAMARRVLPMQATVRIAVHPGDTSRADLMASINRTVRGVARTHTPARYADLRAS